MSRAGDSDSILTKFDRKITARKNLQALDEGKSKDVGKPVPPSEDEEAEKPPFKPG